MSRSILSYLFKKAFQQALSADLPACPEQPVISATSRREFMAQAALGLGLMSGISGLDLDRLQSVPDQRSGRQPVITIIGGGMAGLNCAYQLQKAGYKSTVYESSGRFGGRMFTAKNIFGPGITTDFGGEWVDEEHFDIKALCTEFGIELYDSRKLDLQKHTYYFEGKILTQQNMFEALLPYVLVLKRDVARLPAEINVSNAAILTDLDQLSVIEYLDKIDMQGWLRRFLILLMEGEYGADASLQSCINLLIILRPPQTIADMDNFEGLGAEVMKIKGGSQNLCKAIYEKVSAQVHFGHELLAVDAHGKGFMLSLRSSSGMTQLKTDYLVLTLPFSRLRKVKLNIPLPAIKKEAIGKLAYGNSAKLILGFHGKPWAAMGHIGKLTSDEAFHSGWDSSLLQTETDASYTIYSGGSLSEKLRDSPSADLAAIFIPALDRVYPGMKEAFTGKAEKFIWETYPHNLGAYSYYQVGHWTSIAGHEGEPVGQLYFAGEHCSQLWQGYMNGAALSARLTSAALITGIRKNHSPVSSYLRP